MDEFIDPCEGKMIAQTSGRDCDGCFYYMGYCGCPDVCNGTTNCRASERTDKRNIIWVKANAEKRINN